VLFRSPRSLEVKASSVRDASGQVVAGIKVIRDISSRKLGELELKQAKEDLERKVEELKKLDIIKDGLLRDVSHELKTPVAKQALQLELLRNALGGECPGKVSEILKVMEASVRRQEQVIRNLLDLSRLESGERKLNIRTVRIDEILQRVIEDYRTLSELAAIGSSISVEPLTARGDEEMLWHVFSNLVNNAIKFRKKDEPCRINTRAFRKGGDAVVEIIDNGIGLSPGELPRVFDRFFQVSASVEGSGVGLALCKFMVEAMGGTITLASAGLGRGVTATVRFPAA
jgi:signal transduction histidine kinase